MKILFHRHTEWQGAIRCSTNIFASLAMASGHEVAYMHGKIHLGNLLLKTGRWKYWKQGARFEKGALVFTPLSIVPHSKVWPFNSVNAAQASYKYCLPSIKRILQDKEYIPDIIWSTCPGSTALKKYFPDAKFIFQVVDYYPAFSGKQIKKIEYIDYHASDHIFVIGQTLKNYLMHDHSIDTGKITVLGQGVFADMYKSSLPIPDEIRNLPRPIAVWVGVLSKCDQVMLIKTAEILKSLGGSLLLIGPGKVSELGFDSSFDNVYAIGPKMPELVPAYLGYSDLALMLYDQSRKEIYQGQNPLKLYEYAAAGLPILSTMHDEYEFLDPPVLIVRSVDDIEIQISKALKDKEQLSTACRKFVEHRSWNDIFSVAQDRISKLSRVA